MSELKDFMIRWVDDELDALHQDKMNGFDVTDRSIRSLKTLKKLLNLEGAFK